MHIGRGEGVGEPLCCRKVDGLSGVSSVGSKRRTVVRPEKEKLLFVIGDIHVS